MPRRRNRGGSGRRRTNRRLWDDICRTAARIGRCASVTCAGGHRRATIRREQQEDWCRPWSSKPAGGACVPGGFDSHMLPPNLAMTRRRRPSGGPDHSKALQICGVAQAMVSRHTCAAIRAPVAPDERRSQLQRVRGFESVDSQGPGRTLADSFAGKDLNHAFRSMSSRPRASASAAEARAPSRASRQNAERHSS